MKKSLIALIGLGLLVVSPSCKKGENDPALSLSSRKSRLAGEYNLDSWVSYTKTTDSDNNVVETTITLDNNDGTRVVKYTPDAGAISTETRNITVSKAAFSFTKDGTFVIEINTTTTWSEPGGGWIVDEYIYSVDETSTELGTWSFLGGESEEFKNKERVMMSVNMSEKTTQTTTETVYTGGSSDTSESDLFGDSDEYASGQYISVYNIDMLKGKEMVLKQDKTGEFSNSTASGALTVTFTIMQEGNVELRLVE